MIARLATPVLAAMTILFIASSMLEGFGRMTRHHAFLTESAALAVAGVALIALATGVEGRHGVVSRIVGVVVLIFGTVMTGAVLTGMVP